MGATAAPPLARLEGLGLTCEGHNRRGCGGQCGPGGRQHPLHGAEYELMNLPAVAETDFQFGRVGVDIHESGIEREIQDISRMPAVIQHIAIGDPHRVHQQSVAYAASVDEPVLLIRLGPRSGRQADPATELHRSRVMLHGH